MTCPSCGGSALQGRDGAWSCALQCGWRSGYTTEITTTPCPHCQATVAGVNGRYACTLCGWSSFYVPPEAAPVCTPCRDGCTASAHTA